MTAEAIAEALGGRKAGGGWTARCLAHDDRTPSLSIRDADDNKVLVRCHAGCGQVRVICGASKTRLVGRERSTHADRAQARSRRHKAHLSGPRHLAIRPTCSRNAGRDLSRLARHLPADPGRAALSCRSETSLGRHLAGDGGAGHERRRRNAHRNPSHLPCPQGSRESARRSAEDDVRPCRGGAVRLADAIDVLMVGEGIETCLAAILASG